MRGIRVCDGYLVCLDLCVDLPGNGARNPSDNPFIALVAGFLFVCAGTRYLCVISYWIDTLVLKN